MKNKMIIDLESIRPNLSLMKSRFFPLLLWSGLLMWIVRVTVFAKGRNPGRFTEVDAQQGLQIAIVLLLFLLILTARRNYETFATTVRTSPRILIGYYLICALSAAWSVLPQYSLYMSFEFLVLFIATLTALSCSKNFLTAERTLLFIAMAVMFLGFYRVTQTLHFQMTLEKLHTNSYTVSGGMILVYCFGEYFQAVGKRKIGLLFCMLMGFAGVAAGTSSGSILSVMGGICLILFFNRQFLLFGVLVSIWAIISLLDIDFVLIVKKLIFYGKTDREIVTGTGRLDIWRKYWGIFLDKPLGGCGFAVLSSPKGSAVTSQPHNSLLSAALGSGLLGISMVFAFLVKLFFEIIPVSIKKIPGAVGAGAALATGISNSFTNPFMFDRWEESSLTFSCFLAFFILFVLLPYRKQKKLEAMEVINNH